MKKINGFYELMVQNSISSAHFLRGYKGKCENLHGHNYKIQVFIRVRELDKIGLGMDFSKLKAEVKKQTEHLDHKSLNSIKYFKKVNPSSENISRYLFDIISRRINKNNIKVFKINVWESDSACASYCGEYGVRELMRVIS